jgi:dTDP-4-amino-4,6-dideoxygalactose transaminase
MTWRVPLADAVFGLDEQRAIQRVAASGWFSMGPETEQFEVEFATYIGTRHAIAVSSGTAALHLAILALGIGRDDEVILPSLNFVAGANMLVSVGARPVFTDINGPTDLNISPDDIEHRITSKTKAIMAMHYAGFPCDMERILSVAQRHGIHVIEDAAHAPGASLNGKKLGSFGQIGCFSFFSNKNMYTGEGGMVVTDDDDLQASIRRLRSHGMTALTWDRHRGHTFSYDVTNVGYNYRIDEIRSALGRAQLAHLDQNNRKRRELTERMRSLFREADGISIPFLNETVSDSACHIFPTTLESPDHRTSFMRFMKEQGVQTSIHYPPTHLFSVYRDRGAVELSATEDIASREVTLPLFPNMSSEQVDLVLANVLAACRSLL